MAIAALFVCSSISPAQDVVARNLVKVDPDRREVRVLSQALRVDMPLEFICVVAGTADHEALVRTRATPSAVHAALLGLGMEPGQPLRYSEAADQWLPPTGPPVRIEMEWSENGKIRRERVGRLIRNIETGQPMPPRRFVFVGSRVYTGTDGNVYYGADATGQIASLVNFEFPVIDVGDLASSSNELLEWETDPDVAPPAGTEVTMILSPVGADKAPATRPAVMPATADDGEEDRLAALRAEWERTILPRSRQLQEAAQAHYELMQAYQDEINKLIDEADRLRREKEKLQEQFDDLTTPQPTPLPADE
jgi:hypothetical protein